MRRLSIALAALAGLEPMLVSPGFGAVRCTPKHPEKSRPASAASAMERRLITGRAS